MSRESRELAAVAATVLAAFTVLVCAAMLIADAAVARKLAPLDAARIEALEERVRTDAGAAAELEAERKRQTDTSLAREKTNQRLGWLLLAASAAFLTGAKRLIRIPPPESPSISPFATGGAPPPTPGSPLVPLGSRGTCEPTEPAEPEIDLAVVDELVARHGRGREAAIPLLQALQSRFGYLPEAALRRLAERSGITPAQIAGVASFYARFRRSPAGEHLVRVCHGTACHVAGARHVDEALRRQLAIPPGADTDPRRRFTLEPVACVGCCSLAPVLMVGSETAGRLPPATAGERLAATVLGSPRSGATEQA